MAIQYKFEEIKENGVATDLVMHFAAPYKILEEFFFGDVKNFLPEIKALLQKVRLSGEKQDFSGNICFMEAAKEKTVVGLLYGSEESIRVNTQDLLALVVIYEETETKFLQALKMNKDYR